jgi:DNA-binding MarR family transcriptional regulator
MTDTRQNIDLVDEIVSAFSKERPDIEPGLLELASRLIVVGRLLESRGARLIAERDGHYTDYDVLGMLRTAGSPYEMTPAVLMRRVMLTSGAMTACLKRMETKGLITRRTDETDRRIKHVRLTEKGVAAAESVLTRRYGDLKQALAGLTKAEAERLIVLLRKTTVILT